MAVTVKIPTQLRDLVGGASKVDAEGATVGEALESLFATHEELRDRLFAENGDLRRFVNIYVGGDDIRTQDGLKTAVPAGGELTILPAVAGG
jgi:molybdopterin synthase sulfur carrier subunit